MTSDEPRIPLANAIRALRAELVDAVRAGESEELRFALGPVELELRIEAGTGATADGGIKFWVVSAGGDRSRSTSDSHTVRLTLTPVHASSAVDDHDVLVASELEERG